MYVISTNYHYMKRCIITIGMVAICSMHTMYAFENKREVAVSLHGATDNNIEVMIHQNDGEPVTIKKDQIYNLQLSNLMSLNLFYKGTQEEKPKWLSLGYPVKSSASSLVLKPSFQQTGLSLEVDQETTSLYTLYAAVSSFVEQLYSWNQ